MNPEIIAVFIPIVGTIVIGLILVTYFYFRSREKQMLIEKGLDAATIKEFFESKKDPSRLMKIGIIVTGFGLGLGLGLMLEDYTFDDYWVPFLLFLGTGLGFVVANLVGNKFNNSNKQ